MYYKFYLELNKMSIDYSLLSKQINYVNNDLSYEERKSIEWYSSDNFNKFNQSLRSESKLFSIEEINLKNIDSAFANSPPLEKAITVYRGRKKEILTKDEAFVSTSLKFDVAKSFTNNSCCIFQITVPAGSKVLPIRNISAAQHEEEVLLPRNCDFIILEGTIRHNTKVIYTVFVPPDSISVSNLSQVNINYSENEEDIINYIQKYKINSQKDIEKTYKDLTGKKITKELLDKIRNN